jgi:hypothetical protein
MLINKTKNIRRSAKRTLWALFILIVTVAPISAQIQYFPDGALAGDKQQDDFLVQWYSKHLQAMGEPSLWELSKDSAANIYRFVYLRTFDPPIVVRLSVQKDGSGMLITKITSGKGGYEPGHLLTNRTSCLDAQKVSWFLDRMNELSFWERPSYIENPSVMGVDGAHWIMEGVHGGKYHAVDRWSPECARERVFGIIMMIDLAKLKLLYQEVY